MGKVDTNKLTKLEAYYKITPGSKAEKAWHKHWKNRTKAWQELKKEVEQITGIKDPLVATRGQYFAGLCIEDSADVPNGFRLANQKETQTCEGKRFVYPNGKTKRGKVLKKALDPNRLIKLPDVDELVSDLGLGYGKSFFTIGNKFYRGCGYKETDKEIKISACLFKHESGKFYLADEDRLVDKIPVVDGMVEIPASEY